MNTKIDISHKTVIFTVFFILGLWLLFQIREIILVLFISLILMSALKPWIEGLERLKTPRPLAILLIYIFIIAAIGLFFTVVVPPLVNESGKLFKRLPEYSGDMLRILNINADIFTQQASSFSGNIVRVTFGIFSDIITLITIFVFTFYLLLERKNLDAYLKGFIGEASKEKALLFVQRVEQKLGAWVRGQIALCFVIGVASYLGLKLLHIDYALPLALVAGVLEIVPIIGPIVSAIPAVIITFVYSPVLALAVAGLYFLIQQLENNIIVPRIMQEAVGLKPLVTIIAIMIGGKLMGVTGMLLSVPLVAVAQIVLEEFLHIKTPEFEDNPQT